MNYCNACNILELSPSFNQKELKHNYYLKALQYHPDKNQDVDAISRFQEISDAYIFLNNYKDIIDDYEESDKYETGDKNSYSNILDKFLNSILNKNVDTMHFISILNNKCSEITIELLNHFSKDTLLKFHKFVMRYSDILHVNKEIIERIEILIENYTKNDNIKYINPTLDNLINDEIYMLEFNNETYYIPTWHHELVYELSNNLLIVQCEPVLPDYITMDQYNNLYLNISASIKDILNKNEITINIGNKCFIIPVCELLIKKCQRYILKQQGISLIDTSEIYNVDKKGNIYIDISFTDI